MKGAKWAREHHFDTPGKLPKYATPHLKDYKLTKKRGRKR